MITAVRLVAKHSGEKAYDGYDKVTRSNMGLVQIGW